MFYIAAIHVCSHDILNASSSQYCGGSGRFFWPVTSVFFQNKLEDCATESRALFSSPVFQAKEVDKLYSELVLFP